MADAGNAFDMKHVVKDGFYLARQWTSALRALGVLICLFLTTGCDRYATKPLCSNYLADNGGINNYIVYDGGSALRKDSRLTWYRCLAGAFFAEGFCRGTASKLTWEQAQIFASDLSEKSNAQWRVASAKEIKQIVEPDCVGPALDSVVFPDIDAANLWTSSNSWKHNNKYACSIYSYNGALSCKQPRKTPLPFLLVSSQQKPLE